MQNEVLHAPVNTKIYDLENEKSALIKQLQKVLNDNEDLGRICNRERRILLEEQKVVR